MAPLSVCRPAHTNISECLSQYHRFQDFKYMYSFDILIVYALLKLRNQVTLLYVQYLV